MPRKPAPRTADFDPRHDGALSGALAFAGRRPIDTLAGVLAGACAVMVFVNALALQSGRHPAPLFGEALTDAARPAAPQRNELVAQIQEALTNANYYDGAVDGLMGARTGAAIRTFEQAQHMEQTGSPSDRVLAAALIAPRRKAAAIQPPPAPVTAPVPVPKSAPATTGSTEAVSPKLMAVQRALAKLGYGPVSIDGKMGAGTRAAIISFERDRNMPETGEANPTFVRALQATIGVPLQ